MQSLDTDRRLHNDIKNQILRYTLVIAFVVAYGNDKVDDDNNTIKAGGSTKLAQNV